MNTALLLDINSIAFSAYPKRNERVFKERKLLTSTLFQNVVALQEQFRCDIIVAVFDGGSAFRKTIYPEYKAKRKDAHSDILEFKKQIVAERPLQQELFTALGIPWIYIDGLEGDDIIALLTKDYTSSVIVSRDSDMHQLITPTISVYDQVSHKLTNFDNFHESYIYPISEYKHAKALIGDTSDNICGIPGVGPKAVENLYTKYGTLVYEQLLDHATELSKAASTAKLLDAEVVSKFLKGRLIIDLDNTNQLLLDEMPCLLNHLVACIESSTRQVSIHAFIELTRKHNLYALQALNLNLYKGS